jgi:hypothetical protein
MGYNLHIIRRNNWEEKGNDITSEEWLLLVANDTELQLQPANGPFFVIWKGSINPGLYWLNWSNGEITTKNPDDALIDKMVTIAHHLGAKVQGDDGEVYKSSRDSHKNPKHVASNLAKVFLIIGGIVLYFIFVELTMYILYHRFDSNSSWPLLIAFLPWSVVMLLLLRVLMTRKARRRGLLVPKMKLGEILPADEMKLKYNLTIENYKSRNLNPINVPQDLRDLTLLAQKWGIGDDIIRDDLHQKVSDLDKQVLKSSLDGRIQDINLWLDSFNSGKMTEEAAAFMYMLEGLDEMGIEVKSSKHIPQ